MMQMLLMLVVADEERFARSLGSFLTPERLARLVGIFDASLAGIEITFWTRDTHGALILVGVAAQDIRALEFGDDSSWQNCAEFTAVGCARCGASKSC
jgi:hypothetical protein